MTTFLTILLSILVFVVVSVVVGAIWYYCCVWNEAWRTRDYRILAVAIPITFLIGYGVVGAAANKEVAMGPVPCVEISPVKKHKKKVVKKEEDDGLRVELPPRRDEDGNPIQEGEGSRD